MDALPLDLTTALCRSVASHGDLPRLAGSSKAFSRVVRRVVRDRSAHGVWRLLCELHQPGAGALAGVTDYCALYFRLRGLQAPTRIPAMTISDVQLLLTVTMWTAEPDLQHRSEIVLAAPLHGAQAIIADGEDLGYKWALPDGGRLFEAAGLSQPVAAAGSSELLAQVTARMHR